MKKKKKGLIILIVLLFLLGFSSIFLFFRSDKVSIEKELKRSNDYEKIEKVCYPKISDCTGFLAINKDKIEILNLDFEKNFIFNKEKYENIIPLGIGDNFLVYIDKDRKIKVYLNKSKETKGLDAFIVNSNKFYAASKKNEGKVYLYNEDGKVIDKVDSIETYKTSKNTYYFKYNYDVNAQDNFSIVDGENKNIFDGYIFSRTLGDDKVMLYDKNSIKKVFFKKRYEIVFADVEKDEYKNLNLYKSNAIFDYKLQKKALLLKNEKKCRKYIFEDNKFKRCSREDKKLTLGNKDKFIDEINKKSKNKFFISKDSIFFDSQRAVIANRISDKSSGIYDLDNNKYIKLYDEYYKIQDLTFYVDYKDQRLLLSVTFPNLDKKDFIYDMTNNKKIYEEENPELSLLFLNLHNDNYKTVIKSHKNPKKNNKDGFYKSYILKGNKVIKESKDKKYELIGKGSYLEAVYFTNINKRQIALANNYLYDIKTKKEYEKNKTKVFVATNSSLAYILENKNDFSIVFNDKNKRYDVKGYELKGKGVGELYYLNKDELVYDNLKKTKKYKLKENELPYNEDNKFIGILNKNFFINNFKEKSSKIINNKGKVFKKFDNSIIRDVYTINNKIYVNVYNYESKKEKVYIFI